MNRKEWLEACYNHVPGITYWRDRCEGIRKTLQYNENPNAIHKHHLFNTPEQIAYNNEHYELWGFEIDENGISTGGIKNPETILRCGRSGRAHV